MTGNDPLIGKQLGDYEIQGLLGQGGMARVYKGYDDRLDRYAAVKVIEPNLTSPEEDDEYRERFQREARAIARLNHPRVVGVYQFNNLDKIYYMAMVFIEGQDLRHILKHYIKRGDSLSYKQIMQIVRDTAEALDYSHKQGVIHRDVKPSNIMIQEDGHAVLTDFGLALNAQEGTIGNTFGSVHYIAPEQAMSSAQAVAQSDLYSLGVVLYEMLVGRVPFEDVSAMTVALQHISDPPPPPRTLNPEIPQAVEDVVIKLLDKDPLKRYGTGAMLVEALETAFDTKDDEKTQDLAQIANAPSDASDVDGTSPRNAVQNDSAPIIMSPITEPKAFDPNDNIATISDSSKGPSSLPFTPIEEDAETEQDGSSTALITGIVAVVIVIAVIVGALLLGGGGDGEDTDATSTAQAIAIIAETDTANDSATITAQANQNATVTAQANENTIATADAQVVNANASATADSAVSATESAEVTESVTDTPDATNTTEPTVTEAVTNTPDASATPMTTPTATATLTVTPSIASTLEGTPTFSAAIATQGEEAEEILLRYTGQTLILFNRSSRRVNISGLSFVRLSDNATFRASEWNTSDNNLNSMRSEMCYQAFTTMFFDWNLSDPPADICLFRQGLRQTVRSFWTSRNLQPDAMFEVRLDGETLAVCPVTEWNTEDETYCLVDMNPPDDE